MIVCPQDPILRRSGMYTVAMAYAGTGNNKALRQLLHVAVRFNLASFRLKIFKIIFRILVGLNISDDDLNLHKHAIV